MEPAARSEADAPVDCSILVPVLNEERHIEQTVAAIRRQRFDGRLEFLFADGGSHDRTAEILERLSRADSRIRLLRNPRRTVSSGLNVALAHARGRWIARIDGHSRAPEDYVALGIARLARGDTRWVSGPQVPVGHGPVSRAIALALSGAFGRGGSRKWHAHGDVGGEEYDLDTGVFAGVWERATLLEVGGWDERWVCNEDSEMAARFLERHERLVCLPAMATEYSPRDSLYGLWRQYLLYGRYRARTYARHPSSMRPSHLLAPAVVMSFAAAVLSPRPVRRAARAGDALYATVLIGIGVRAAASGERPSDAALLPVVLAIMHVSHGLGQLDGWRRHGPPIAALAALAGKRRRRSESSASATVYAPSLRD